MNGKNNDGTDSLFGSDESSFLSTENDEVAPGTSDNSIESSSVAAVTAQEEVVPSTSENQKRQKKKWKKPKDKPKRPLSAYNFFFAHERQKLKNKGAFLPSKTETPSDNFGSLARRVAAKWKQLDEADKADFKKQAEGEQARYKVQLEEWKIVQNLKKEQDDFDQQLKHLATSGNNGYEGDANNSPLVIASSISGAKESMTDVTQHNQNTGEQHNLYDAFTTSSSNKLNDILSNSSCSNSIENAQLSASRCIFNDNILDSFDRSPPSKRRQICHASNISFQILTQQLDDNDCEFLASLRDL